MQRSRQAPWFAFIVHPRSLDDACRSGLGAFMRYYSSDQERFHTRLYATPPLAVAQIRFGFSPVWGELISVFRLPEELSGAEGARAVTEGVALGIQRGAGVIGLGALTSPATGGGLTLLSRIPKAVTLTNGNAYTATVVAYNVKEAAGLLGLGTRARVAVVGCTGSVGVPTSHLLADAGFPLILVGRSALRASRLLSGLTGRTSFAGDLTGLRDADIVVLLTSDPSARLTPDHVRESSVVIDCAQPANIETAQYPEFERCNIRVFEGGIVRVPGYSCGLDFGLSGPEETFACLAETYLLAREGIRESSVGRPSADQARKMERIADRRNIQPRALRPSPVRTQGPGVGTAALRCSHAAGV